MELLQDSRPFPGLAWPAFCACSSCGVPARAEGAAIASCDLQDAAHTVWLSMAQLNFVGASGRPGALEREHGG